MFGSNPAGNDMDYLTKISTVIKVDNREVYKSKGNVYILIGFVVGILALFIGMIV